MLDVDALSPSTKASLVELDQQGRESFESLLVPPNRRFASARDGVDWRLMLRLGSESRYPCTDTGCFGQKPKPTGSAMSA